MAGLIKQLQVKVELRNSLTTSDPRRFVESMVNSNINKAEKSRLNKRFRIAHHLNQADIIHSRNRSVYYKKLKNKNVKERIQRRNKLNKGVRMKWTNDRISEFIRLVNDKSEKYVAIYFGCTIPAVQSLKKRLKYGKSN